MSKYYNPNRKRNLYDKSSKELFRLSRGKIDDFIACPRCFYLDRKLGVAQPPGFPFSLNSAVDKLLKIEFVYCNGNTDKKSFDAKLEFDIKIIPYEEDDSWVEGTIFDAIECLKSDKLPSSGSDCDFCKYRRAVKEYEK